MPFPTERIERFISAGYRILYLVSWEEERVESNIKLIGKGLFPDSIKFYTWSCTEGMKGEEGKVKETHDVIGALDKLINNKEGRGFYVFKDLNFFIGDPRLIRKLKDAYQTLRDDSKVLFILSPSLVLPYELEKEITVIDVELPDADEAGEIFDSVISTYMSEKTRNSFTPEFREKCIRAMLGLGAVEMELALRRTFIRVEDIGRETIHMLLEEKAQLVRKSGTLEFVKDPVVLDAIGGLENLKEWLQMRALAFSPRAREFGLDMPKGVLLMGISGCGKSLCAKAVATAGICRSLDSI
jgi:hypothetical protein